MMSIDSQHFILYKCDFQYVNPQHLGLLVLVDWKLRVGAD